MSRDEQVFCTFSNPCWFYLKFYNVEEPDEKHTAKQPGAEGSVFVSLRWILGLYDGEPADRVVVPAQEWNELFLFQRHSLLSHTTSCGCFPTATWESLFSRLSVSQVSGAVRMADSQESLPNTLHRSNKRVWFFFFWTAHPHFIAHFNSYTTHYIVNTVGLGWKH